jgi:hypothetical protein
LDSSTALDMGNLSNKFTIPKEMTAVVKFQMKRLSHGRPTNRNVSPLWAMIVPQVMTALQAGKYRR